MAGVMKKKRIGYFGGTFDPPHLGHVILAQEVLYQLKLDSLAWLVTPDPPHKKGEAITPVESRLEMLELIIRRYPDFEISRVDLDRPAPHYAADSVELARELSPSAELVYLLGEDSLQDLPDWYQPGRFLAALDQLAVAPRPGVDSDLEALEQRLPGISQKTVFLSGVVVEISSSLIRDRIRAGAPFQHFLDREVAAYLSETHLYR
jgi:nicotinate-nucleotide adenylyltransferase